jgi:predicted nucleic acid-binding Zn ribbon protein
MNKVSPNVWSQCQWCGEWTFGRKTKYCSERGRRKYHKRLERERNRKLLFFTVKDGVMR